MLLVLAVLVLGAGTATEVRDCCDQLQQPLPEDLWTVLDGLRSQ